MREDRPAKPKRQPPKELNIFERAKKSIAALWAKEEKSPWEEQKLENWRLAQIAREVRVCIPGRPYNRKVLRKKSRAKVAKGAFARIANRPAVKSSGRFPAVISFAKIRATSLELNKARALP